VAFGVALGGTPDRLMVGLAVLSLLAAKHDRQRAGRRLRRPGVAAAVWSAAR
jgi:hypothetical protein